MSGSSAKVWTSVAFVVALALGCTGVDRQPVRGSGVPASEQRRVEEFQRLELAGAVNAEVTIGPETRVTVEADDNLLPIIETEVAGGTLTISSTSSYSSKLGVKVTITVPRLEAVAIRGSGDVAVGGLNGGKFSVAIAGSGGVQATGSVESVNVAIRGSGDVRLADLKAATANVSISGSGDVTVNVAEALDVSVAGSGDVNYVGNPKVSKSIAGSGDVRKVG